MASDQVRENVIRNDERTSPAELSTNTDVEAVSKLRQTIPQVCAISARNLSLLINGSGWYLWSEFIENSATNGDTRISSEDQLWMTFAHLIGCIIGGPISHFFGRQKTMMISNIPLAIYCLLIYFAGNHIIVYIASCLFTLSSGLHEVSAIIYVAEVTQPRLRGMLSATWTMVIMLGKFTQILAGSFIGWRTLILINAAYSFLCVGALYLVPESPYWLAGKGRLQEAESALCWLRGWVTPAHVREEFQTICESVCTTQEKPWKRYTRRTFLRPFVLMIVIFFISDFSGVHNMIPFAHYLYSKYNIPIDIDQAAVFYWIAILLGTFLSIFVIQFTGKRKLVLFSTIGMSLGFIGIAVYTYLIEEDKFNDEKYTWLLMIFIIVIVFVSYLGFYGIPWILIGEVFPGQMRSGATAAVVSLLYVFAVLKNRIIFYLKQRITFAATFSFYAYANFMGAIVLYFMLPETEGRTLQEIENHYAGIRNLKDKSKKEELPLKECSVTNPVPTDKHIENEL